MPIQTFPLTGGMNQAYDVRILPDGVLANAVNCEIERIGRIVPRAKYTAIASSVYGSGSFVGYDLFSVGDRMFALGDRRGLGYPTEVYEYIASGTAAVWKPTATVGDHRLPRATRLREIARTVDTAGGVTNFSVAAFGGFVCLAYNNDDPDGTDDGVVHIVLSANDQTIALAGLGVSADVPCFKLKALALSDRFTIIGTNSSADKIGCLEFVPTSDEAITTVSTSLYTGLGTVNRFTACKVEGVDQFVVVANIGGTLIIRRFSAAGVLQNPSGGAYADISANATHLAVYANNSDNRIFVAYEVAGVLKIQSYNLSTGATLATAVTQHSGVTVSEVAVLRLNSGSAAMIVSGADANAEDSVYYGTCTVDTGLSPTSNRCIVDASLTSTVVLQGGELVFAIRYGSVATGPTKATNCLVSGIPDAGSPATTMGKMQLLAVKDLEIASPPGDHLPEIVLDSTSNRYYWANAILGPDGDGGPVVTEFGLGLAERRQVAIFGSHVYIAGAMPCVFDLRLLAESGFPERPRIISLTGGSGGSLLPSCTYKYRLHPEQVDALNDLHLGPPSEIQEITLSSSQNKVTARVSTGHSMRRNLLAGNLGASVRHVLSRSLATADNVAPSITGTEFINPPSTTLSTLTLKVMVADSTATTPFVVTFDASATTQAQILSQINAVTTGRITATAPDGLLVLTADEAGENVLVGVFGGTGLTLLGLTARTYVSGTTTRSTGENFQRAASAYNPAADLPGEFVDIVDTRADESDPIVDTDLIRQAVLYSQGIASGAHHSPPPSDCVWAGKERVGFFRQAQRNRWTVSKVVVPGEPVECANGGFLAFSGQVSGEIEAGAFIGGALALWTRQQIWLVTGDGPQRNGSGVFNQADCLTRSIGLIADGWMSMLQDDEGVWFQGSDAELYRISNGGQIEWLGKPVREYLQTYPRIVASVYRQKKREVAFAVTNANGSAGGILRRNALVPDSPAWFFDDVGAVSSLSEYQGRLAYVQSGTVYLQDASPGSGTFPTVQLDSGCFQGFQGLGYGALQALGGLFTFRGRCTVTLKIGEDGTTFPDTIAQWAVTSSEYTVGQRFALLVDAPKQTYDQFALRCEVSDATGTTEGVWLHAFAVQTENQPDFVRLPPSRRL